MIIFGHGLDRVPGLFSVKTRFLHLYFVPLVPTGSIAVIESSDVCARCSSAGSTR